MNKALSFLGISVLLFCGMTFAQTRIWKTYATMNEIRDIVISDQDIWCATNGGIFKLNSLDNQYQQFTNVDGLNSIDVRAIEYDSGGDIWIGLFTGVIHILHKDSDYFEPIYDYQRHIINDLVAVGDSVLIGFDNGVSLYVKSNREVKESYYTLGNFEDRISVNKIYLDRRDVWAATDYGIAKSSLEKVNLKDPESWINYTTSNGLPGNVIRDFARANDVMYAATEKGVARLNGESWQSLNNGLQSIDVNVLFENQDTLYAGTREGVFRLTEQNQWTRVGNRITYVKTMAMAKDGTLWIGRIEGTEKGLAFYEPDSASWQIVLPPGPAYNKFIDVVVDKNKVVWCACERGGIATFDGATWTKVPLEQSQIQSGFVTTIVDQQNRKWFGSLGGGITLVDDDGEVTTLTDPYLSEASSNYYIVNDLDIDSKGNIWIINRLAMTRNPLAVITPDLEWQNFAQTSGGISTDKTWVLTIDQFDRVWVGTDDKGITVLNPGDTPTNTSDDQISGHLTISDGLYSNQIQAIVEDLEGVMWIGTNKGLNRWYTIGNEARVDSVFEIISNDINALEVDAQNNIWVGTTEGITMIPGSDRFARVEYSSQQSPLVSDYINSITYNGATGDLYVGTSNGLSVLGTGFTAATAAKYDSMQVYPNPFRYGGSAYLTIKNLARNTISVQIFTINGLLVRNIPADNPQAGGFGGHVVWNGQNDKNEPVASGIYIIVAHSEDGQKNVSKVAVIRE
ncbi:hypothetical protein JXJ21_11520 [candidate division KSB1 bacterium]|nr:hypothetical protein [candidate division KSB1 bacterium]